MLKELLQKVEDKTKKYVCWSGVMYDFDNRYIRADKVFLNVIHYPEGGDTPVYTRIPSSHEITRAGEKRILFATDEVVRILSGPRKGTIVPLEAVKGEETYKVAGVKKLVKQGRRPGELNKRSSGDRQILQLLKNPGRIHGRATMESNTPYLYLTCKGKYDRIQCRSSEAALNYIRTIPGYVKELPMASNLLTLSRLLAQPAGDGRSAYPFDTIYGRGVISADVAHTSCVFGKWVAVDSVEVTLPHIRIGVFHDV
jgi:hypothetical protein